jgi:imidazolonepropionase-like amidohydrolase
MLESPAHQGDVPMNKNTLNRVIDILESDPDIYVPVKRLWLTLRQEGLDVQTELEAFSDHLHNDARFEFAPGASLEMESPELDKEGEREMEALGFFVGPRVKLASREMTADDIFTGLRNSLTRMNDALQNAWKTRPEGDQETEDQLLEILAAGQKLEREIQDLLSQDQSENT